MHIAKEEHNDEKEEDFVFDSGATNQMIIKAHWITSTTSKVHRQVTIGNGNAVPIQWFESVEMLTAEKNSAKPIHFRHEEALLVRAVFLTD